MIAYICPSNLIIESIPLIHWHFLILFFILFLLIFFMPLLFLLLVKFSSTVQIGPIRLNAVLIESLCCYIQNHCFTIEVSYQNSPFGKGKTGYLILINNLIFLRFIKNRVIRLFMLVMFEMLLHLFKRI